MIIFGFKMEDTAKFENSVSFFRLINVFALYLLDIIIVFITQLVNTKRLFCIMLIFVYNHLIFDQPDYGYRYYYLPDSGCMC